MDWIWKNADWPHYCYDKNVLERYESAFLHKAGMLHGALKHIADGDKQTLTIQIISDEALKTSEIEGKILDRESVQSSIQRHFGLKPARKNIPPAEHGISEMMVDLYTSCETPLDHETLFRWHMMLTEGRRDLSDIGRYRTGDDPMQIVSNRLHETHVHYEAPASKTVKREMDAFLKWFNASEHKKFSGALARAGIAHLHFESIHPFEDGNGRIGRAICEKSLSQNLGRPSLIALAQTIENDKKSYYAALQRNSRGEMDVTDWLLYFSQTLLSAQDRTQRTVDFLIAKIKFFERLSAKLNARQEKVVTRMFKEGIDGFKGGLSAENYIKITGAPRATATRDLHALVEMGALTRRGERRYTRYQLNIP